MPTIWPSIAEAIQNSPHTAFAPMPWDPASLLLARFGFGDSPASRAELAG